MDADDMSLLEDLRAPRDHWLMLVEDADNGGALGIWTVARGANPPEFERELLRREHEMANALGYNGPLPSDDWVF